MIFVGPIFKGLFCMFLKQLQGNPKAFVNVSSAKEEKRSSAFAHSRRVMKIREFLKELRETPAMKPKDRKWEQKQLFRESV